MSNTLSNLFSINRDSRKRVNESLPLSIMKDSMSFGELCNVIDEVPASAKLVHERIFGNALPKEYASLGRLKKYRYINTAKTIISEINWTILAVRQYKKEIKLFLEYKKDFENDLILGDYTSANLVLSKIEKEICCSLWSLESRFLLLERSKSPEDNKKFLSDFNDENKGFFLPFLSTFLNYRTEKNFSVSKYNSDLYSALSGLKGERIKENYDFNMFMLNIYEHREYTEFKAILAYNSYHSVIDRYLALVKVLKLVYVSDKVSDNIKDFVASRAIYLANKIGDSSLYAIATVCKPQMLTELKGNKFEIKIADYFTSGLYREAIAELTDALKSYPDVFEYYIMYVKSFIYGNIAYVDPNKNTCLQNSILREIYSQLVKNNSPRNTLVNISRLTKTLSNFKIGDGLHKFFSEEFGKSQQWNRYNLISISANNPELADFYSEEGDKLHLLGTLLSFNSESITIEYYLKKFTRRFDEIFDDLKIPFVAKQVDLARYYQNDSQFEKAKEIWEYLLKGAKDIIPVYETSIRYLFECYIKLDKLDYAASIYVDSYLYNKFVVSRIEHNSLQDIIRRKRFRGVSATIDLPLFYTLSGADENEVHIAYEMFLTLLNIEKPSQMNINKIDINIEKVIAFLHQTCTVEVFKHSMYIDGSKEGIAERISVLRLLQTIDGKNTDAYKVEIDSLTNILIVQEGLQQLDESKIYVNEQGLINYELKEFEGLYNRYKTIANILNEDRGVSIYFPKSGMLARMVLGETEGGSSLDSKLSAEPLTDTFKEIFDVIIDKFINSKFGISAYLSTRIRHGVLLGEVRPIFEKYNLIGQFDKDLDKYREVEYWGRNYKHIGEAKLDYIQRAIAELSERIDQIIYRLLKTCLQIKTNDSNDGGWFDYTFSNKQLSLYALFLNRKANYTEFIKGVIEIAWQRTDENLELIRLKIRDEVKAEFTSAISDFSTKIQQNSAPAYFKYSVSKQVPEIDTNVITCLTDVQTALDRIASWFNRSGSRTSDFYISKIVTIVLQNINHSYSTRSLDLSILSSEEVKIKGEYYSHFADLFRIILDNALEHSDHTKSVVPLEVEISVNGQILTVNIKNSYPDPMKVADEAGQGELTPDLVKLISEGKSGFYKVVKIIQSDLRNEHNEFQRLIDEDYKYCVSLKINLEHLVI